MTYHWPYLVWVGPGAEEVVVAVVEGPPGLPAVVVVVVVGPPGVPGVSLSPLGGPTMKIWEM